MVDDNSKEFRFSLKSCPQVPRNAILVAIQQTPMHAGMSLPTCMLKCVAFKNVFLFLLGNLGKVKLAMLSMSAHQKFVYSSNYLVHRLGGHPTEFCPRARPWDAY